MKDFIYHFNLGLYGPNSRPNYHDSLLTGRVCMIQIFWVRTCTILICASLHLPEKENWDIAGTTIVMPEVFGTSGEWSLPVNQIPVARTT